MIRVVFKQAVYPWIAASTLSATACASGVEHPRLAYDPEQVSRLQQLLNQPAGLTIIQGATAAVRTFVITALGHSSRRPVTGIDVGGVGRGRRR